MPNFSKRSWYIDFAVIGSPKSKTAFAAFCAVSMSVGASFWSASTATSTRGMARPLVAALNGVRSGDDPLGGIEPLLDGAIDAGAVFDAASMKRRRTRTPSSFGIAPVRPTSVS